MLQHIIVILEEGARSFCHYETAPVRQSALIPLDTLKAVVRHAVGERMFVSFVHGASALPPEYEELMNTVEHVRIVPAGMDGADESALQVIDLDRFGSMTADLQLGALANVVLRFGSEDLETLAEAVAALAGKCRRLNLIVRDAVNFTGTTLDTYRKQLESIRELLEERYRRRDFTEISLISDRLFLAEMNNCGAGCTHVTLAPNGRFYICPAFYYDDPENHIGDIAEGFSIPNRKLLELSNAPICRNCDAYHCKRCLFLNRQLTGELNTPSSQQCTMSHTEREVSRKFLEAVNSGLAPDRRIVPIPEIAHTDPFEVMTDSAKSEDEKSRLFAELLSKPLEGIAVNELLSQLYRMDPNLLSELKRRCCRTISIDDL